MPILRATNSKKNSFFIEKQGGFSIIEILLSLFLITLIFFAIPVSNTNTETKALENAIDAFDRATRFAAQEAVLRNCVVRLRIDLDKTPNEYVVEYGPKDSFILPEFTDSTVQSLDEEEKNKKKANELDSKFAKVAEFDEVNKAIEDSVKVMGVSTSYRNALMKQGMASIYFYPSGERDAAIIILSTSQEVAALDIQAYNETVDTIFKPIDLTQNSNADIEDVKEKISETIYKDWLSGDPK